MRKMQQFAPEMKKIQKKYANDRQRQAAEMQKLQREHGVSPLGGCLPMVFQIPVFLGLNHVLRSFRPDTTEVYFFKSHDVQSYLHADLFGAHLGDALVGIGSLGGTPGWHWGVAPVAIPLMIVASIATHFTARLSVQRQAAMGAQATGQAAFMGKLSMYIFPLGVLIFGGAFPVGLLLYWLSNNCWTLAQQHFVMKRMDREEAEAKAKALEQRAALGPKPGQKPQRKRTAGTQNGAADSLDVVDATPEDSDTSVTDAKPTATGAASKPKPGQKPKAPARSGTARTTPAASSTSSTALSAGAAKRKTNGKPTAKSDSATEIPGLISDRSRRKRQDRKRG
jgi:YidC/Oxa1 family membrane protein insertase